MSIRDYLYILFLWVIIPGALVIIAVILAFHWPPVWHWLYDYYRWAVINNLWKDVISYTIAFALGFMVAHRPWQKHRDAQNAINDKLDTQTPGGLGEIRHLLKELTDRLNDKGLL